MSTSSRPHSAGEAQRQHKNRRPAVIVVVMGVSGSGKTTVGQSLAARLGVPYADADEFHPAANIAKMSAKIPLDDADRMPWLRRMASWITEQSATGAVLSCSALKHRYRDVLREPGAPVWFLHLAGEPSLIMSRVSDRPGHFMPAALVASQYADLEPLGPDESGLVVDAAQDPVAIVETAAAELTKHKGVLA